MNITINGKVYDSEELTPEQADVLQKLRLTESIGELMNMAHDMLNAQLAEQFPNA